MSRTHIIEALTEVGFNNLDEAFTFYDRLEPISDIHFLSGRWRGLEIPSKHKLNGRLAKIGWYGKVIQDPNNVHPLMFYTMDRKGIFSIHPRNVVFNFPYPAHEAMGKLLNILRPMINSKESTAAIQIKKYRGKNSAALVYNNGKIVDHYRWIDEDTVCGMMEGKNLKEPLAYLMVRDDDSDIRVEL